MKKILYTLFLILSICANAQTGLFRSTKYMPQGDAPNNATEGQLYYDTDGSYYYYNGSTWENLTSADFINKIIEFRTGIFTTTQVANLINIQPSFEIEEGENYFIVLKPFSPLLNQNYYVYTLIDISKGMYGQAGQQLSASNVLLLQSNIVTTSFITDDVNTQFIDLGDVGSNDIVTAFNAHTFANPVQEQDEGYVIIDVTINSTPMRYLFLGEGGNYGGGGSEVAVLEDFTLLSSLPDEEVLDYISLSGTEVGSPVTGDIEINSLLFNGNNSINLNERGQLKIDANNASNIAVTPSEIRIAQNDGDHTAEIVLISNSAGGQIKIINDDPLARGITSSQDFTNNIGALDYVQKIYVDNNLGLTPLDEGNGIGWRLNQRDAATFGNRGANSIDFGFNYTNNSSFGALGDFSFNHGEDNKLRGYGSIGFGVLIDSQGTYSFSSGFNINENGYSNAIFGMGHDVTNMNCLVAGQASNVISRQTSDFNFTPEKELFVVGNGTIQNGDIDYTVITRSNAFLVRMNGEVVAPSLSNSTIQNEATGRVVLTRDYFEENSLSLNVYSESGTLAGGNAEAAIGDINMQTLTGQGILFNQDTPGGSVVLQKANSVSLAAEGVDVSSELSLLAAKHRVVFGGEPFSPLGRVALDYDDVVTSVTGVLTLTVPTTSGTIALTSDVSTNKGYTVATLPASPNPGDTAYVTDADAPTWRGTVTGGGSEFSLVVYDGTNWIYH